MPKKPKLDAEQRKERARQAVNTRWENERKRKEAKFDGGDGTPPPLGSWITDPIPATTAARPVIEIPPPPPIPAPEPPKRPRRPRMVKEFGVAHSYAEKRLAEAIRERAQAMGKVAMLNAEIPSLVAIIKALGNTPDLSGMQPDFTAQMPGVPYVPPSMQGGIDPAMLAAPIPAVPLARGGGLGVIPDTAVDDENQFLRGEGIMAGSGWR